VERADARGRAGTADPWRLRIAHIACSLVLGRDGGGELLPMYLLLSCSCFSFVIVCSYFERGTEEIRGILQPFHVWCLVIVFIASPHVANFAPDC
jgi:hypothetical protein